MRQFRRLSDSQKVVIVVGLAAIVFAILMVLASFCGAASTSEQTTEQNENTYFEEVFSSSTYKVVYDKETYVMYTVSNGHKNKGDFTMLVNADGTPKLYEANNDNERLDFLEFMKEDK